jgi:hypothetical protein
MKGLPDLAYFKPVQGNLDISNIQIWPGGAIELVALLFKVCVRVEQMSGEFREYITPNITPGHTVDQVWQHLSMENPELRKEFTIEPAGFVHSGQVIIAKIQRKRIWLHAYFQVIPKRWIRYENVEIWNVWSPVEIWNNFARDDPRILPFDVYTVEDRRPWEPYGMIEFVVNVDDVPDTTGEGCGAAGGDGPNRLLPRIDPVPPGRDHGKDLGMLGARRGQAYGDSSATDSEEDSEDSDTHKLAKIKHAIADLSQPVQVILNGRYLWQQNWEEVSYCRTFVERKVSKDILEPLRITAHAYGVVSLQAGAETLPLPIQALAIPRSELEITVAKR